MKLTSLSPIDFEKIDWMTYDLIFLASGFEDRSIHILKSLPKAISKNCLILGFEQDRDKLSRVSNDIAFKEYGVDPFVAHGATAYENKIKEVLLAAALKAQDRTMRIFVDYSVMTRIWYGYILTWLKYSENATSADVDFAYCQGEYHGEFDALHIEELTTIPGFEGGCAGARRTVAFYGLGYDKYATLAVHELIEPDSIICFVAKVFEDDTNSNHVIQQNDEIIEYSGSKVVFLPLGNIAEAVRILHEQFSEIPDDDEIIVVPMGPKTHVLATLMVAQLIPKVTCLHARGARQTPVQVTATGKVNTWRAVYK